MASAPPARTAPREAQRRQDARLRAGLGLPAGAAHGPSGGLPPAPPRPTASRPGLSKAWMSSLAILAAASAVLFWAFRAEIAAAVQVWSGSAAYGHAFFIVPVCLFLFYRLRHRLGALQPAPALWALGPITALSLVWMVGALANVMVVKQLAVIGLWQALFLLVLGRRISRAALFPLAYLIFAVPFGASIVPALQDVTAQIVVHLLRLSGIPVFLDGYLIQIPSGNFLVAEACSGVRYLIVSLALGFLAAYLFLRSWRRRIFFIALSVVVPIVANGIRAYGIVMLAHLSDYRLAVNVDHVIYGLIFLIAVTLILLGLVALLREREPADGAGHIGPSEPVLARRAGVWRTGVWRPSTQLLGAGAAVAIVLLTQAWAAAASHPAAALPPPGLPAAAAPWAAVADGPPGWVPAFHGSDVTLQRSYRLGNGQVDVHAAYYGFQREEAEAISDKNALLDGGREWHALDVAKAELQMPGRTHPYLRMIVASQNDTYVVWYWYRIAGQSTNSRFLGKLLEMKAAMIGGDRSAAMIAIASRVSEDARRTDALLRTFLEHNLAGAEGLLRFDSPPSGAGGAAGP